MDMVSGFVVFFFVLVWKDCYATCNKTKNIIFFLKKKGLLEKKVCSALFFFAQPCSLVDQQTNVNKMWSTILLKIKILVFLGFFFFLVTVE